MTYTDYVDDYIRKQGYGDPIYTEDISLCMADEFSIENNKAAAATSVALKRLLDDGKLPELRRFQKGIYYRARSSAFGETRVHKGKIIDRKYIEPDKGYETGAGLFYRMGLTTQLPAMRYIATNAVRAGVRYDEKLGISICAPKTEVTAENKGYLRVLDVLYQMDEIPYDVEHPYDIISDYIDRSGLKYDILLAYADRLYNHKTVIRLGHVARSKGERKECHMIKRLKR